MSRDLASAILDLLGCEACDDMATGGAIYEDFLASEKIVPAGINATVIMSTKDTLVDPSVSRVENESNVRNVMVQDTCPDDPVGHAGLAWDSGVWDMVRNELDGDYTGPVTCVQGLPA